MALSRKLRKALFALTLCCLTLFFGCISVINIGYDEEKLKLLLDDKNMVILAKQYGYFHTVDQFGITIFQDSIQLTVSNNYGEPDNSYSLSHAAFDAIKDRIIKVNNYGLHRKCGQEDFIFICSKGDTALIIDNFCKDRILGMLSVE